MVVREEDYAVGGRVPTPPMRRAVMSARRPATAPKSYMYVRHTANESEPVGRSHASLTADLPDISNIQDDTVSSDDVSKRPAARLPCGDEVWGESTQLPLRLPSPREVVKYNYSKPSAAAGLNEITQFMTSHCEEENASLPLNNHLRGITDDVLDALSTGARLPPKERAESQQPKENKHISVHERLYSSHIGGCLRPTSVQLKRALQTAEAAAATAKPHFRAVGIRGSGLFDPPQPSVSASLRNDASRDIVFLKKKQNNEAECRRKAEIAVQREKFREHFHQVQRRHFEKALACMHPHALDAAKHAIEARLMSTQQKMHPDTHDDAKDRPVLSIAASQITQCVATSLRTGFVQSGQSEVAVTPRHGQEIHSGFSPLSYQRRLCRELEQYETSCRPPCLPHVAGATSRKIVQGKYRWRREPLQLACHAECEMECAAAAAREIAQVESKLGMEL